MEPMLVIGRGVSSQKTTSGVDKSNPQLGVHELIEQVLFGGLYPSVGTFVANKEVANLRGTGMRIVVFVILLILAVLQLPSQVRDLGVQEMSHGTEFVVGFPQVWAATSEKPLPRPMLLFISSPFKTKVRIQTLAVINDAARIDREITIDPDEVLKFPIPLPYMNQESGTKNGYSIVVTSDRPVSVSTFQAWEGNGELVRFMPSSQYGTEYRTINAYLDRYGSKTQGYKYRPSQILIINDSEPADVTIRSPLPLEFGKDLVEQSGNGGAHTVSMDPYETMLVKWEANEDQLKIWESDPTGTVITSTSKVGLVSGATKVAVMRMTDRLPPSGLFAAEASFVRNNITDNVPPVTHNGTEFLTVPFMYTTTRVTGEATSPEFGIDDDRGDVVRVMGLEDATSIERQPADGGGWNTVAMINAGETYMDSVCTKAYQWRTSKPVQCWQYGKSYAKIIPPTFGTDGSSAKRSDNVQGHPTVESGMPQLTQVPPVSRFVSYGTFHSPEGMDNFFNVVFPSRHVSKIKIDGKALNSAFGSSIEKIKNSDWSMIQTQIGVGDHTIESESDSIKWMAWTYGSLDGLQMGRAYSSPVGVDDADRTQDSVEITLSGDKSCYTRELTVEAVYYQEYTAGIATVYASNLDNVKIVRDSTSRFYHSLTIEQFDTQLDAKATIVVAMTNGHHYEVSIEFGSQVLIDEETTLDVGLIDADSIECRTILVRNETQDSLAVSSITATGLGADITISETSFVLLPSESKDLEICIRAGDLGEYVDTLRFLGTCDNDLGSIEVTADRSTPHIWDSEVVVPLVNGILPIVVTKVEMDVDALPVTVDSITTSDERFTVEPLEYPLSVVGGSTITFDVRYTTDGDEHENLSTEVFVHYNQRDGEPAKARIVFERVTSVNEDQAPQQQIKIAPHPIVLSDGGSTFIDLPSDNLTVSLLDVQGRVLWTQVATGEFIEIPNSSFSAAGIYSLIVYNNATSDRVLIFVVE